MQRLRVAVDIDAPVSTVWTAVADVRSHVAWMDDARAITFASDTTFDCLTVVGPFRLRDRMEIVEWDEGRAIGIEHVGLVRGRGRFTLEEAGPARTRFTWEEELAIPWWLGGPLATPVLGRIWRRNLRNLRLLVSEASVL